MARLGGQYDSGQSCIISTQVCYVVCRVLTRECSVRAHQLVSTQQIVNTGEYRVALNNKRGLYMKNIFNYTQAVKLK